ncbi:AraC family transcriptional regulator [Aquimarina sp. MAR_2010_214]|uniref:helix-turn-helix domain-containing protein n=1 Tax=Aquimarina sp. MAR_2010_214 TaxID=1250026 RepID=UPI000C7057A4|nr:AraC family transcriptional regulator [Aquimarina sp. MAR_2010_214]PKV50207.1 AraC family transcriptional regulator [Aquimarina sp. MAR_2010_214]
MKKKIKVQDCLVKNVVIDLANSLGIDYENSNHEYCVRLPEEYGSGYMKSYQFDFGVGIVETDYLLKKEFNYQLEKGIIHPLKIMFNRESGFYHKFENNEEFHEVRRLENVMISSTSKNNHVFKTPANTPICIFSIEINRKLFEEKIELFLPNMNEDLIELFRDVNGINQFYYKNYYSLEISKFISEFTECELTGFMRQVYLEGKAYEILTHQLQQYLDDLNEPDKRLILRQATIESIEDAVSIIREEIDSIGNIVDIAKRVGLNQNTLQNGFKQLYKTSVNEYIKNYRIDTAKDLLESSNLNITEITYKVGINSRSYFTKLFKKRFGVTPKQYLNQVRNKKNNTRSA